MRCKFLFTLSQKKSLSSVCIDLILLGFICCKTNTVQNQEKVYDLNKLIM